LFESIRARLPGGAAPSETKAAAPESAGMMRRLGGALIAFFASGRLYALVLLASFLAVQLLDPLPVRVLRLKIFDAFQAASPREFTTDPAKQPVVIIDLDEESLATVGQWPWPRTVIGALVERLHQMGVLVIGFDIVFPEPDRMSPRAIAETVSEIDPALREQLKQLPSNDQQFAQSIRSARVVAGQAAVTQSIEAARSGETRKAAVAWRGPDPRPMIRSFPDMVRNVPEINDAAAGRGMFTILPEVDGVVRRVPAVVNVGGSIFPTLSIEMLRVMFGDSTILILNDPLGAGLKWIAMPSLRRGGYGDIPTDRNGMIWIHYSRHDRSRYVSAASILDGTTSAERVRGKLALIGTSAVGLLDIKQTPVAEAMPGVEVHAQFLENVLAKNFLFRPNEANVYELMITAAGGLLMIIVVPLLGARWSMLLFALVGAAMAGGSWYGYTAKAMLLDTSFALVSTILLFMFLTYISYSREEVQRRMVRKAFSRYLAPAVVERLAVDPSKLQLGGELRTMTLLFSDVRGFTTISEQFDAQGLTSLINKLLTPMTEIILKANGTIDKYMGDAIMAFWNAPLDDVDHARNACDAALEMRDALLPLNEKLAKEAAEEGRKHIPVMTGVGVNTGECCVGNMGSDQRFDYSVLGDTVNLAARLEGQTKDYGVGIIIGETTRDLAPDYAVIELDKIQVKGKTVPVTIFALLGPPSLAETEIFQSLKQAVDGMLQAYRSQDWDGADSYIAQCRKIQQGMDLDEAGFDLTEFLDMYAARLAEYREYPPDADWDGVYVATSK
jgi:adenylate cyclase